MSSRARRVEEVLRKARQAAEESGGLDPKDRRFTIVGGTAPEDRLILEERTESGIVRHKLTTSSAARATFPLHSTAQNSSAKQLSESDDLASSTNRLLVVTSQGQVIGQLNLSERIIPEEVFQGLSTLRFGNDDQGPVLVVHSASTASAGQEKVAKATDESNDHDAEGSNGGKATDNGGVARLGSTAASQTATGYVGADSDDDEDAEWEPDN